VNELLGTVSWFPQDYAAVFYIAKGVVAVFATVLVVGHMMHTWRDVTTWGRRLRYFALLACTALMSFASVEQLNEAQPVSYRNLGAIAVLCLVIWAMFVSIREDLRR
jgi:hypothetical protein